MMSRLTIKFRQATLNEAKKMLADMALALIDHEFASTWGDDDKETFAGNIRIEYRKLERVDPADRQRWADHDIISFNEHARMGLEYITAESVCIDYLETVPMAWLSNDHAMLLTQHKLNS